MASMNNLVNRSLICVLLSNPFFSPAKIHGTCTLCGALTPIDSGVDYEDIIPVLSSTCVCKRLQVKDRFDACVPTKVKTAKTQISSMLTWERKNKKVAQAARVHPITNLNSGHVDVGSNKLLSRDCKGSREGRFLYPELCRKFSALMSLLGRSCNSGTLIPYQGSLIDFRLALTASILRMKLSMSNADHDLSCNSSRISTYKFIW